MSAIWTGFGTRLLLVDGLQSSQTGTFTVFLYQDGDPDCTDELFPEAGGNLVECDFNGYSQLTPTWVGGFQDGCSAYAVTNIMSWTFVVSEETPITNIVKGYGIGTPDNQADKRIWFAEDFPEGPYVMAENNDSIVFTVKIFLNLCFE